MLINFIQARSTNNDYKSVSARLTQLILLSLFTIIYRLALPTKNLQNKSSWKKVNTEKIKQNEPLNKMKRSILVYFNTETWKYHQKWMWNKSNTTSSAQLHLSQNELWHLVIDGAIQQNYTAFASLVSYNWNIGQEKNNCSDAFYNKTPCY